MGRGSVEHDIVSKMTEKEEEENDSWPESREWPNRAGGIIEFSNP